MANSQQLLLHHPAHVRGAAVAAERSSAKRDIAAGRRRMGEPPRSIVPNDSNRPYLGRARTPAAHDSRDRFAAASPVDMQSHPNESFVFKRFGGATPQSPPQPLFMDAPTPNRQPPRSQPPRPRIRHAFTFQPPPRGTKGTSQRRDKGIPNAAAPFQPLTLTGKEKNNP